MHALAHAIGAAVLAALACLPASAQDRAASPLIVSTVADIQPVASADGLVHLVYELLVVNQSAYAVSLDGIAVLDQDGGMVAELSGSEVAAISRLSLIEGNGALLQPSQSAFVFLDVVLPAEGKLPVSVAHRFTTSQAAPASDGLITLGGLTIAPEAAVPPPASFMSSELAVRPDPAIVLMPPLRGDNWVAFRGCCDVASSHRGNTAMFGGEVRIAERFAVDFVRINEAGLMIDGPPEAPASYVYYGENIYAVADGVVVSARSDQPDQVPGALPGGLSNDLAGGNAVVLDIGGGHFAFYAHMQQGSVALVAGDQVKAGDLIGRLGNSGRTIGPHLHFQVTDNPSPLDANGLPFVFSAFEGQGVLTPEALGLAMQGKVAPVDSAQLAGPHRNVLPVNSQVLHFSD